MSDPVFNRLADGKVQMTVSVDLPHPLDEVFAFFSRPENLAKLTPPSMGFRMLNQGDINMEAGTEISYRIRPMGLPLKWVSKIETWNPPHEFSDLQLKGPFSYWLHSHRYTAVESGTRMEDHITYKAPGGAWIEKHLVRKQLIQQFAYRTEKIQEFFPES